jgi:hypothetical protein
MFSNIIYNQIIILNFKKINNCVNVFNINKLKLFCYAKNEGTGKI